MGSKHRTLQELFQHQLKDLYDAERHLGKAFGKMAKAAGAAPLRTAFEARHDGTDERLARLDHVFEAIGKKEHGLPCEAMHGLIAEVKALLEEFEDSPALDAGLIASAQAMDHYAVARYAALRLWAGQLGLAAAVSPLQAGLAAATSSLGGWAAMTSPLPIGGSGAAPLTLKEAALLGLS